MSINYKAVFLLLTGIFALCFGCATTAPEPVSAPVPVYEPPPVLPTPEPEEIVKSPAPRTLAALHLTEQAQALIEAKRADEAIRVLEKSLNMDPQNGRNYFLLAAAWLLKGNISQATACNRQAGIYLGADKYWRDRIQKQKEAIAKRQAGPLP